MHCSGSTHTHPTHCQINFPKVVLISANGVPEIAVEHSGDGGKEREERRERERGERGGSRKI